jgi:hypothetical protein
MCFACWDALQSFLLLGKVPCNSTFCSLSCGLVGVLGAHADHAVFLPYHLAKGLTCAAPPGTAVALLLILELAHQHYARILKLLP